MISKRGLNRNKNISVIEKEFHFSKGLRVSLFLSFIFLSLALFFIFIKPVTPQSTSGLISYWPFDINANDNQGSNDGIVNGATHLPSDGKFGGAFSFDGVNDYIDIGPMNIVAGSGNNGLTIAIWFKADSLIDPAQADSACGPRLISKATGFIAESNHYWMLGFCDSKLRFRLKTEGTTTTLIASNGTLQTSVWTHAAVTYDGTTMRLYKDGVLERSISKSGTISTSNSVSANIGRNPDGSYHYNGLLDDARIYNRALSQSEIQDLFNINTPPVLQPIGNQGVDEGQTLTFTLSATDADNDQLTYSASNLPTGASFDANTQIFTWTPGFGSAAVYPDILFIVSDGTDQVSEPITITVGDVNRVPVLASIGDRQVDEGQTLTFTLSATDADNDQLTYSASNLPTGASFDANTQIFTWTPGFGSAAVYSNILFIVSDGTAQDSEPITITVGDVNRPSCFSFYRR